VKTSCENQNASKGEFDLPLNAELEAEGTSGKFAECAWDDPERDEHSDEEHEDAGKQRVTLDLGRVCSQRYSHDRKTTSDILAQATSNHTTPTLYQTVLRAEREEGLRDGSTISDDRCERSIEL